MKYAIYKIKPNKFETWKNWCNELNTTFREEALKTLAYENILFESFIIFNIKDEPYTLGCILEKDGGEKTADILNELNQKHQAIKKECLGHVSNGISDCFLM